MLRSLRRISITVGIIAALLGTSQASVIAAPLNPAPARAAVAAPAPAGGQVGVDKSGPSAKTNAAAAAPVCYFYTQGDYVHISGTAFEASGHGWWINIDCPATWAVVTVQLQEYYSDGSWRNKGTVGRATVRSGGGAGNRATGRAGCNTSSLTGWRSVVDVDLVGVADSPDKVTTAAQNIYCRRF